MGKSFIGREKELRALQDLYEDARFQLFILYGRRRVGKTTLMSEFCRDKDAIFFSATESSSKFNLERFSEIVFRHYGETTLAPFASWENALAYIDARQGDRRLVLVLDEFPYLARKNAALLSELQHLIDHRLQRGRLFLVLSGSYMGFMEKEVLSAKSPLFGRRTGQLHLKGFDFRTSFQFCPGFSPEEKMMLYGILGGTPHYLQLIQPGLSFAANVRKMFLVQTAYLYEEPLLLLRQELQEPALYNTIIEAVAHGASKANEIATRVGESSAACLKYIGILCDLGILAKETPFGEKESSRRTIYGVADLMFRFWYRYVYPNRTLIETGAGDVVWEKCIRPNLSDYMGLVFERASREWLLEQNVRGALPFLFTSVGRWWGSDARSRSQVEIDLIAKDAQSYLLAECKWRGEKTEPKVFEDLQRKAQSFARFKREPHYFLFSKSGFTSALAQSGRDNLHLVSFADMIPDAAWKGRT